MENDTNINNKKSNNTLYYTAFSFIALLSCSAIVILTIAPYVEFLAPVVGFATLPTFIVLAIPLVISIVAILCKLFSKENTISQEAQPVEKAEGVEKCDNAGQPVLVAEVQQIPDELEVKQPAVIAEEQQIPDEMEEEEPYFDALEQLEQPNQTDKGDPKIKQDEQPKKAKEWSVPTLLSSIGTSLVYCYTTIKGYTLDPICTYVGSTTAFKTMDNVCTILKPMLVEEVKHVKAIGGISII